MIQNKVYTHGSAVEKTTKLPRKTPGRIVEPPRRRYNGQYRDKTEGETALLEWSYRNYSFDADLQIVRADVRVAWDGDVWVEEPLCVDVGLPALAASLQGDTAPNRFGDPVRDWRAMPFLVCGCGDPECRAHSFAVKHLPGERVRLTYVEERPGREPRELAAAELPLAELRRAVTSVAEEYLRFVEPLDYRPLLSGAPELVRQALRTGKRGKEA
jgi:hypothetical protein